MKEELAIRAVKAFPDLFPDHWKHDRHYSYDINDTSCLKCKCKPSKLDNPCTVPDSIDINWNVAMTLVRECDGDDVRDELVKIWAGRESIPVSIIKMWQAFSVWLITRATPADYIEAAYIAKEAENGN